MAIGVPFGVITRLARLAEDQRAEGARRFAANNPGTQATTVGTTLGDVALGGANVSGAQFKDPESLITSRVDPALGLLSGSNEEQLRLQEEGRQAGLAPLARFSGLEAFNEQQALLGLQGPEAQAQAIGNMPVSDFDRELMRRNEQAFLRRQAAAGELGGGATIQGGQQLAGAQQAALIQKRLDELLPLVAASRGVRSTMSGLEEASRAGQAATQFGLGAQQANIRLGTSAPLIESRLNQANTAGLRTIASAQNRGQTLTTLAGLAGQFAPQISSFFSPQTTPTATLQTGTNAIIPEGGTIGIA